MTIRKTIFWAHLGAGVAVGLLVAAMSVTGTLLAYELQITRLAERAYDVEPSGAARLGADALAEAALRESGGKAATLTFSSDPAAPVAAGWGRSDRLLLDPYTGASLGTGETWAGGFFDAVTRAHRWLVPVFSRETGGAINAAANLAFLFLLVSGAWLWLPRLWKWRMFRNNLFFRRDLPTARARDFNWHHVFGIWALVPLFVIVLSGVVISYPWAGGLLYAAYGEEAPARRGPPQGSAGGAVDLAGGGVGLQRILDQAEAFDDDWNRITLALPAAGAETVSATVDTGTGRQPARQTTLAYALDDGGLAGESGLADRTPAARARTWMRFAHTGEYYGLAGQTVAALASIAALVMVYTGLALSYRRLVRPFIARRASA